MQLSELETLMQDFEGAPNVERQTAFKTLGPLLELHREALQRIVSVLREHGQEHLLKLVARDPLVDVLLRGYGLVEVDLTARVEAALQLSRPGIQSHGGDVHLVEVRNHVAILEMTGSCHGCASSLITLKRGIEKNLYDQVPELRAIEVVGLTGASQQPDPRKWIPLVHAFELKEGEWVKVEGFDEQLLVCTLDDRPFVFRNECPAGGGTLEDAVYHQLFVECPCHGHKFDLRTGNCSTDPSLHLVVYPATLDDAVIKIAMSEPATQSASQ